MSAPAERLEALLCELTYRCNLQCGYCYNPLDLDAYREELATADWQRVLDDAGTMGVRQVHFSGGEPTLRRDLPELIAHAYAAGLYTNLITQGTFLDEPALDALEASKLDHVQVSVQGADAQTADAVAGTEVHARKLETLERLRERPFAVTLNCVLHRGNHDGIAEVIALAERYGVGRLELANVQFYGWAHRNRAGLMPTREQVRHGAEVVARERVRLKGRMEIVYVLPDYFEDRPKPCMNGWGRTFATVTPNGFVLPCPAAAGIASLTFDNVRERSLPEIWRDSAAFTAYRGTAWMPEPCRSCERQEIDWGGCRCQAFLITGDAGSTDPACALSPDHALVEAWRDSGAPAALVPRRFRSTIA